MRFLLLRQVISHRANLYHISKYICVEYADESRQLLALQMWAHSHIAIVGPNGRVTETLAT